MADKPGLYRLLYRHVLSRFDAEWMHDAAVQGLRVLGGFAPTRAAIRLLCDPRPNSADDVAVHAFGLRFAHPLGLAGGFDKEGSCLHGISALGFSHVEIGTVTPRPQLGNPKPRLFRLAEDSALINRMGFPSGGMAAVARNLRRIRGYDRPILISLGKNKVTDLVDAHQDYDDVLSALYPHGDLFTINVSSPNTPDLRRLQTRAYLSDLLAAIAETLAELSGGRKPKPLLIKIAPDLTNDEIDTLLDVALQHHVAGIIATNTTTRRDGLRSPNRSQEGGLSGQPLRERSTAIIRHIYCQTDGKLPVVGVGGIFSGDDLYEKLQAGATLAQAYTGFIYEGPAFVRKCIRGLRRRMAADGVTRLDEIIGASATGHGDRE